MILYGTLAHYDYLEILRWTIIRSEGMFLGLSWDAKGLFRRESHIHESDINQIITIRLTTISDKLRSRVLCVLERRYLCAHIGSMRLELCFQHYCKDGSSAWEFRLELQDEASPWVHKKLDNGVSLSLLTIIGQSKKSVEGS